MTRREYLDELREWLEQTLDIVTIPISKDNVRKASIHCRLISGIVREYTAEHIEDIQHQLTEKNK